MNRESKEVTWTVKTQIILFTSLPLTVGISILATPIWTIFYKLISLELF